jgi:hypothetical protein
MIGYANGMNKGLVERFCETASNINITSTASWGPSSYLQIDEIQFFHQMIFAGAVPLMKLLIGMSAEETIYKTLIKPIRISSGSNSYSQYNVWNGDDLGPRPSDFQSHTTVSGSTAVLESCYSVDTFIAALSKACLIDKRKEIQECQVYIQDYRKQLEAEKAKNRPSQPKQFHSSTTNSLSNLELMCDELEERKKKEQEVLAMTRKHQKGDAVMTEGASLKKKEAALSAKLQYFDHLHCLYTSVLQDHTELINRKKLHIEVPRINTGNHITSTHGFFLSIEHKFY